MNLNISLPGMNQSLGNQTQMSNQGAFGAQRPGGPGMMFQMMMQLMNMMMQMTQGQGSSCNSCCDGCQPMQGACQSCNQFGF